MDGTDPTDKKEKATAPDRSEAIREEIARLRAKADEKIADLQRATRRTVNGGRIKGHAEGLREACNEIERVLKGRRPRGDHERNRADREKRRAAQATDPSTDYGDWPL